MKLFLTLLISTLCVVYPDIDWESDEQPLFTPEYLSAINSDSSLYWTAQENAEFATVGDVRHLFSTSPPEKAWEKKMFIPKETTRRIDLYEMEYNFLDRFPACDRAPLNQRSCGSCWAFGETHLANERLCSALSQRGTPYTNLYCAPAFIVSDCCTTCGNCEIPGLPEVAQTHYVNYGAIDEACFPYIPDSGPCPYECANHMSWRRDRYQYKNNKVTTSRMEMHQQLMMYGGMTATYMVYYDFFSYGGGVYSYNGHSKFAGWHNTEVVGWGVEGGVPYWYVKNSWGGWGPLKGFFKIIRGTNECLFEDSFNIVHGDTDCPVYCHKQCATRSYVCTGHGDCTGKDFCDCYDGYTGMMCDSWTCNGVDESNAAGCTNHGECVALDRCLCVEGFTGQFCELDEDPQERSACFGFWKNITDSVCNNHGECIDSYCHCENGYSGDDCGEWSCGGHSHTLGYVCTGHGECLASEYCQCDYGYNGDICEEYECYGFHKDDTGNVCSGRGTCSSRDSCDCKPGYLEPYCERSTCSPFHNDASSCNGHHGSCKELSGTCVCREGYFGPLCEDFYCEGIVRTSSSVCTGHGDCIERDVCVCEEGWGGAFCERARDAHTCGGIDSRSKLAVCSGHGDCIASDTCDCDSSGHYTGDNCSVWDCFGINKDYYQVCNGLGSCVGHDQCSCNEGVFGPECGIWQCYGNEMDSPFVCSSHGQCVMPDACACDLGYGGYRCQWPKCGYVFAYEHYSCPPGEFCVDINVCVESWSCFGTDSGDNDVCSSNGKCVLPDVCDCDDGYGGEKCNVVRCGGFYNFTNSAVICNGRGKCENIDSCQCDSDYSGPTCEYPKCFGVSSNSFSVCSSRGTCIGVDQCVCHEPYNFAGDNCEQVLCDGIYQNDTLFVCNGHGDCAENICLCYSGWRGSHDCSVYSCDMQECGTEFSHGNCTGADFCACHENYSTDFVDSIACNLTECFGDWSNSSTVCSGHGICSKYETCSCSFGYNDTMCDNPLFFCNEIPFDSEEVCSSNGVCNVLADFSTRCSCSYPWTGTNCNEHVMCFGELYNSVNVCSREGSCTGTNKCQCNSGFTNSDCSVLQCYSISSEAPSVCGGNGTCQYDTARAIGDGSKVPGLCKCDPEFYGRECKEFIANITSMNETQIIIIEFKCPIYFIREIEFPCSEKIVNADIFGINAQCSYTYDETHVESMVIKVVDDSSAIVKDRGKNVKFSLHILVKEYSVEGETAIVEVNRWCDWKEKKAKKTVKGGAVAAAVLSILWAIIIISVIAALLITFIICKVGAKKRGDDEERVSFIYFDEGEDNVSLDDIEIDEDLLKSEKEEETYRKSLKVDALQKLKETQHQSEEMTDSLKKITS